MTAFDFHIAPFPIQVRIEIERGCLGTIGKVLPPNGRVAILADKAVESAAERLRESLGAELFYFSGKEAEKTRETKHRLEDELLKRGFGKDTIMIGLGGGITTDLAAFLASTYMRGIPLILIPTTLLAMVDAALGGKTAVDTPFGKNLIGSFYHPKAILIDPDFLDTLPERERLNGLAEMLKYGLIRDKSIWDKLAAGEPIESLIHPCAECKLAIVKEDPEDEGPRRILNFGHTIGHAIEQESNYRIAHGEAVAIGCLAESHLSMALGYLPHQALDEIVRVYQKFKFPLTLPPITQVFWESLSLDKKSVEKEARFVLIDRIGRALTFDGLYCRLIPRKSIEETLHWMIHGPLSHPPE